MGNTIAKLADGFQESFCTKCNGTGVDWSHSTMLNPRPICTACNGKGKVMQRTPKGMAKTEKRIPYDDGSAHGPLIEVKVTTLSEGNSKTDIFTVDNAFNIKYISMLEAEFINTIARNNRPPDERKYIVSDALDGINAICIEISF